MKKYEFGDYFEVFFISYIVLDIQKCSVMLKTALFDCFPQDVGVNSRKKSVLDWANFDFSSILDFAKVISYAVFSSFMS